MKHSHDYDSAFQSIKNRHKRLFIAVINDAFGKHYPLDSEVAILPAKNVFHNPEKKNEERKIEERENDFLLCICGDYYLIEAQTYDDESMSLRLAEYTFLAARSIAQNEGSYNQGHICLQMPHFTVIYIKNSLQTPRTTTITFEFPTGETYAYSSENIFLSDLTKEEIIEKKLFAYIPFYIARYEKELKTQKDYEEAIADLEYFRDEMIKSNKKHELDAMEFDDLSDCVREIIVHITDGNEIEKEVTAVMGGEIYELHSDRIIREATEPLKKELAEKDSLLADKDHQLVETKNRLADSKRQLSEKETENAALRAEIERLRAKDN
jgi:hypothetical protein